MEEVLYPAMEDFFLDIVIGKGPAARSIRLDMPRFTLVGATTRTGLLTGPLRDRFGISYRLDYYSIEELARIVERSARILDVEIDAQGAAEIASRSRGTPRLANRLLKRVRDYAQVKAEGRITWEVASEALTFFEIDEMGLRAHQDVPRPARGANHDRVGGRRGPLVARGRLRALPPAERAYH